MILSTGSAASSGSALWGPAGLAALLYAAAWLRGGWFERWAPIALPLAWVAHLVVLVVELSGYGSVQAGARLGFAPVLSLTVWFVIAVHAIESRLVPLPAVRGWLAPAGLLAVVMAALFPGEPRIFATPMGPLHFVLGVGAYGLFGAAVLHGALLDASERRLRLKSPAVAAPAGGGLPLLQLERLTFRFVEAGFVVLTAALVLGAATAAAWRWDHKNLLSLLGWAVFAALLAGRKLRGWRGRRATRWLYIGALLLLLAYAGSRFVLEVLLSRAPA